MSFFRKVLSRFSIVACSSNVVSGRCGFASISNVVSGKGGFTSFSNQPHAIVTGGAQGLGYIISERLLREGYCVCLADINEKKGKENMKKLMKYYGSSNVMFSYCDVTSEDSFKKTFLRTREHGHVEVLVNNAGIVDEYNVEKAVAVNLMGTITGCQLALKLMSTTSGGTGGTVINIGSIPSFLPYANAPVYVATKHGIVGLTRSYGDESYLKQHGITFTAMCPSYVNTPLLYTAKPLHVLDRTPDMKYLEPEVVGDGISKLLTDKINGSVLLVLQDRMEYAEIPDEMKNLPFER